MNPLRTLDDRLFIAVNGWARDTPALHAWVLGYATYGVVLFAALMLCALVVSPAPQLTRPGRHRLGAARDADRRRPQPADRPTRRRGAAVRRPPWHPAPGRRDHRLLVPLRPRRHGRCSRRRAAAGAPASRHRGRGRGPAHGVLAGSTSPRTTRGTSSPACSSAPAVALAGWALLRVPLTTLTEWLRSLPGLRTVFAPAAPPTRTDADLDELAVVPPPHLAGTGALTQGSTEGRTHP